MNRHFHSRNGEAEKKEVRVLIAVGAVLAFLVVYALASEARLYCAIAAAIMMTSAIDLAGYLQRRHAKNIRFDRRNLSR